MLNSKQSERELARLETEAEVASSLNSWALAI